MSTTDRRRVMGYVVAAVGVAFAALSPWWFTAVVGDTPPMRLILVVVVGVAAWLGGLGPGLFATVMGAVVIVVTHDAHGNGWALGTKLLRFVPLTVLISLLFHVMHASRRRTEIQERAFQLSEDRYRHLIDTTGQGIWLVDDNGRTLYANPRLGEILGMTPSKIVGSPLSLFIVRDDNWWAKLRARSDLVSSREIRLRGADGDLRYAIVTSQHVGPDDLPDDASPKNGGAERGGFLLLVTDVTRLKEAERGLREKESVLRSFYESSQMAMGVIELTDRDARFVSANALCDPIFGVASGELEGKMLRQLEAPAQILSTWNARLRDCRATGRPTRFEHEGICVSSPRWVAATISPMDSLEPARELCSFIVEDITDRKRTEAELLEAKEVAEAASHAKDRFLAVLSHELRTPLTPALIAVASLLESKPEGALLQTLEMIRRNIELEARLIDDLLDLTRISRGRLRLELEDVNIHKLIRRAMEICRDETLVADLHILTELTAERHHVMADHARIMQVVWNLIRNAAKFTPAGGTLTIRTLNSPGAGQDEGESDAGWLVIEFEDTGIGIDPAVLPRLFDPFEQGNDDVRGRTSGLGLGLAISRSLAEALGGRLTASSRGRGQGSTFRLELKVLPQGVRAKVHRKHPTRREASPVSPGRNDLRLLLVEDNQDTLRYLAAALRKRGHHVVTADCYRAALAALKEAAVNFDLLISDIELPDGDGLELMREIRASEPIAGIAMSGFGAEEDLRQSREAGFFDHLTKPIDLSRLDSVMKSAVAGGSDRDSAADDESAPFSLRTDGNSSGTFKIVVSAEPESE